ncbi:MAG TPA: SH3 beta-barrel fold-containing protein [Lutibacter sp.]
MKTQNNFRTKVFQRAYEILKSTGKSFAVCLSKAWALYRLSKKLFTKDEVCFTYEKKDGTLRKAYGTLKNIAQLIKGTGQTNNSVFHYWDLQAVGFRCFKVENLVTIF